MSRKSTERQDPLKAAGLAPKVAGASTATPSTTDDETRMDAGSSNGIQEKRGGRTPKPEEERATEKVTAYFTLAQFDKIEELQRAYRKKTHKRINVNALLRKLVEHAAVEDLL